MTLTESGDTLVPFTFTVTATAEGAPEITNTATGQITLRNTSVQVSGINGVTTSSIVSVSGQSGPWEFVNGGLNTNLSIR